MEDLKPLGLMMSERLVAALGGREGIDGYGKGAIVGEAGELEHGALWHVPGGYAMRELLGGTKAIVPSAKKVAGLGATLDVPLGHIDAAYVRSHFDAMEVRRARRAARRRDRLRARDERRPAGACPHGRPRGRRRARASTACAECAALRRLLAALAARRARSPTPASAWSS